MTDREVIKYIVISDHNLQKLVDEINLMIEESWQPLGSHRVTMVNDYTETYKHIELYSQTMVIYKNP